MAKDKYHQEPCEKKREDVAAKKDLLKACYKEVAFANDVALVTDTLEGAKLLLDRLENAALSVGLAMNDTKLSS